MEDNDNDVSDLTKLFIAVFIAVLVVVTIASINAWRQSDPEVQAMSKAEAAMNTRIENAKLVKCQRFAMEFNAGVESLLRDTAVTLNVFLLESSKLYSKWDEHYGIGNPIGCTNYADTRAHQEALLSTIESVKARSKPKASDTKDLLDAARSGAEEGAVGATIATKLFGL